MPNPTLADLTDVEALLQHIASQAQPDAPTLGTLRFPSYSIASRFRQRIYFYRRALAKANTLAAETSRDPEVRAMAGRTPYDQWEFSLLKGESVITIRPSSVAGYRLEFTPHQPEPDPNAP